MTLTVSLTAWYHEDSDILKRGTTEAMLAAHLSRRGMLVETFCLRRAVEFFSSSRVSDGALTVLGSNIDDVQDLISLPVIAHGYKIYLYSVVEKRTHVSRGDFLLFNGLSVASKIAHAAYNLSHAGDTPSASIPALSMMHFMTLSLALLILCTGMATLNLSRDNMLAILHSIVVRPRGAHSILMVLLPPPSRKMYACNL